MWRIYEKCKDSLFFLFFFSFSLDKVISMLYVHIGYELNYLMTFWPQFTPCFNEWATLLLVHIIALRGEELKSRHQTFPTMWALGENQLFILKVTFIHWMMIFLRLIFVRWALYSSSFLSLHSRANFHPTLGSLCSLSLSLRRLMSHRNYLLEIVPWHIDLDTKLEF